MARQLREYDTVLVSRLIEPNRHYTGTAGVSRPPAVGDTATICHEFVPGDPTAPVAVECVNEKGLTVWLADFMHEELTLLDSDDVERPLK